MSEDNKFSNSLNMKTNDANIFKVGTKIGNYVLSEKIGSGGIGTVYKAYHHLLNYSVAIKVHEYFPKDEVVGVAFLQAANFLSQLNHPNIVRLHDYGFHHDRAYMALEFIEGRTLAELIPKNQTEEWMYHACELFAQLLSAVRYSHNCTFSNLAGDESVGIVHGDIKPQNIFVTRDGGVLKLTDFMIPDVQAYLGKEVIDFEKLLAPYAMPLTLQEKVRLGSKMFEEITSTFGTPRYMPPEQETGKISVQSDIFTLGATLYEMLTGRAPMSLFKGVKPKQVNPFVPRWIEEIIITAMKPAPSERYESVAEMEAIVRENLNKVNTIKRDSSVVTGKKEQNKINRAIKILFLSANPKDTSQLRLDEEIRGIDEALRQTEFRDKFNIKQQWAVRIVDLQGYLLRHKPDIVHFSGHGSQLSEIILEDNNGNGQPVPSRALSQLFSVLKDNIRCVVLNACYSEQQAEAIAKHIDCVIGMSKAIGDAASISFAIAFYQALGYGRDVKTAFDLGCLQIDLESLNEQDTPKLITMTCNPKEFVFV